MSLLPHQGLLLAPSGGGGGGGAHTYWGIDISTVFSGTYCSIAQIEMKLTPGGADQCSGGTAGATSVYNGFVPADAFDGSSTSIWANNGDIPSKIWYQFPAPITIEEFSLQATPASYGGGNEMFQDFAFIYGDDGIAWTTIRSIFGETWVAGEIKDYTVP